MRFFWVKLSDLCSALQLPKALLVIAGCIPKACCALKRDIAKLLRSCEGHATWHPRNQVFISILAVHAEAWAIA